MQFGEKGLGNPQSSGSEIGAHIKVLQNQLTIPETQLGCTE